MEYVFLNNKDAEKIQATSSASSEYIQCRELVLKNKMHGLGEASLHLAQFLNKNDKCSHM